MAVLFLSHLVTQKHTQKALIHGPLSSLIPFTLSTVNMVISSFTSNLFLPLLLVHICVFLTTLQGTSLGVWLCNFELDSNPA